MIFERTTEYHNERYLQGEPKVTTVLLDKMRPRGTGLRPD